MRRVPLGLTPEAAPFGAITVGDTVSVRLTNGTRHRFVVAGITDDALISKDGSRYARADIVEAGHRRTSVIKTSFLAAALGVGGFFLLAFILFATQGTV